MDTDRHAKKFNTQTYGDMACLMKTVLFKKTISLFTVRVFKFKNNFMNIHP